jgi:hypothetical protein
MIKEKLKKALADAVEHYNSGIGANAAIAKTASAYDFNQDQADRLCELFNTAAALNQEKSASDPTGACELADKTEVAKMLVSDGDMAKKASVGIEGVDEKYAAFYASNPVRSNATMDAVLSGVNTLVKAAASKIDLPPELDVSQKSVYKMLCDNIDMLKSAGSAADDIVRHTQLEADRLAVKIAKAIEHPFADPELADLFKVACECKEAVRTVSDYSTKVAESKGGRFAGLAVYDASKADDLIKMAEELEVLLSQTKEFKEKRAYYFGKADEAEKSVRNIILGSPMQEKTASVADFFEPMAGRQVHNKANTAQIEGEQQQSTYVKIAELLRKSGVNSDEVEKLADEIEKSAAPKIPQPFITLDPENIMGAISPKDSIPGWTHKVLNEYRRMLLDDLLVNDPIIRDADPNAVMDIYKSMVMSAPRLSLDPTAVRSVLRQGVNSIAMSPNDLKTLTDVDKGVALANIERLTNLDSSVKDSNQA